LRESLASAKSADEILAIFSERSSCNGGLLTAGNWRCALQRGATVRQYMDTFQSLLAKNFPSFGRAGLPEAGEYAATDPRLAIQPMLRSCSVKQRRENPPALQKRSSDICTLPMSRTLCPGVGFQLQIASWPPSKTDVDIREINVWHA